MLEVTRTMKKQILLFLSIVYAFSVSAQKEVDLNVVFDREGKSIEFHQMLGGFDGRFVIAEMKSTKAVNFGRRALSIKLVDQGSMRQIRSLVYDDIAMQNKKAKYDFLKIWMLKGTIGVLVLDNETAEIKILKIDAKTLRKSTKAEIVYSISERYKKSARSVLSTFGKSRFFYTIASKSLDEQFMHVTVLLSGRKEKPFLISLLIDENFGQVHKKEIEFKTIYQLAEDDVRSRVSSDGRVAFIFNISDYKKTQYIDLKPGSSILMLDKGGNVKGWKSLNVVGYPREVESFRFVMTSALKDNLLYIAGYDKSRDGYMTAIIDLDDGQRQNNIKWTGFSDHMVAFWHSFYGKDYEKALDKVKNSSRTYVSDYLNPDNITIMQNGDMVFVGSVFYVEETMREGGSTSKTYHFENIQVATFNKNNELVFDKLIKTSKASSSKYNIPAFHQKAHIVNGKIMIYCNNYINRVSGLDLTRIEGDLTRIGVIILIEADGSDWYEISPGLSKDLNDLFVYPEGIVQVGDGEFFMPYKKEKLINTAYGKMVFK